MCLRGEAKLDGAPRGRLQVDSSHSVYEHVTLLQGNIGSAIELGTYGIGIRANTVRDYMVVSGIASFRIETVSYGEEQPIAYGAGEANYSQNRRVELK